MRTAINFRSFLVLGFLLTCLGQVQARAETPLVELLKANPEWVGTVDETFSLAVTFRISGDPGELESVSYRWEQNRERNGVDFKLDDKNVEFMILPAWRKRWYKLTLTEEGTLEGSLTGITRDGEGTFELLVFLRPADVADPSVADQTIINEPSWGFSLSVPSRWGWIRRSGSQGRIGYLRDEKDDANISIHGFDLTPEMSGDVEKYLRDTFIPERLKKYSEGYDYNIDSESVSPVTAAGRSGKLIKMVRSHFDSSNPRNVGFMYFVYGNTLLILFISNRGGFAPIRDGVDAILAGLELHS